MKDFNQVHISSGVDHFGKKYKEKWDLKELNGYRDLTEFTVFKKNKVINDG